MNQTQRNYAIERVRRAARQKIHELNCERARSPEPPAIEDVHDALKTGKAKLKSKKALQDLVKEDRYGRRRTPLDLTLDQVFTNLPKPKGKKVDQATVTKKEKEIKDRQCAVIDEIMLGDETVAMKLISEFEKELSKK